MHKTKEDRLNGYNNGKKFSENLTELIAAKVNKAEKWETGEFKVK